TLSKLDRTPNLLAGCANCSRTFGKSFEKFVDNDADRGVRRLKSCLQQVFEMLQQFFGRHACRRSRIEREERRNYVEFRNITKQRENGFPQVASFLYSHLGYLF